MAETQGVLPYDLASILGGAARVIISDDAGALPALPANIDDVVDLDPGPNYAEKTGWRDIGATADSTDYSRDLTTSGWEIEQVSGSIFEEVTEVQRTFKYEMAEITPENLQVLENAPSIATVAAAAGKSAQKAIKIGSFNTLKPRRIAFLAQRNVGSGAVVETAGITRGRFVMLCLYNVGLSADASQMQVQKGQITSVPVTMRSFPEAGQVAGQEFGIWLTENAGTIT